MKTIKYITIAAAFAATLILGTTPARAQFIPNGYANIDWQLNIPAGGTAKFANVTSGWGMNFEAGWRPGGGRWSLGGFLAFHTNNQYIPTQTMHIGPGTDVTTDQQHSVFQMPFGLTGRFTLNSGGVFEPYVGLKLGANYGEIATFFGPYESYIDTWGFYTSPEIGVNIFPRPAYRFGLHVAAYYSYATNSGTLWTYKTDNLSNFGVRVGISF